MELAHFYHEAIHANCPVTPITVFHTTSMSQNYVFNFIN